MPDITVFIPDMTIAEKFNVTRIHIGIKRSCF